MALFRPQKHRPQAADYLSRDKLAWLLVTQALIILPLLFYLPAWLSMVWALVAFWRIQMFRGRWRPPGFAQKALVVVACASGIFISFGGHAGTDTMISMLASAFILKLLEVKSGRDAQLLVFIGFVTTATQLLFNQSPFAALYAIGCCWLLIGSWRAIHLSRIQPASLGLKRGGAVLLHALPVMLVMFLVIPRLGPLWAIPTQKSATTGFSDTLGPGDLGQLVQSKAPAFRVAFEGAPPKAASLYWRGLIMDSFDGRRWRLRDSWSRADDHAPAPVGQPVRYTVILEPHGQHWLFALPVPVAVDAGNQRVWISPDRLLMSRHPVAQRMRYEVTSTLNTTRQSSAIAPESLDDRERNQNLRLPPDFNPQTRALAAQWRNQGLDDEAFIARALAYLHKDFVYTLQPPTLGVHSVDEFLFTTKRGFCEHFASSFAFLLRAAGIPARVVVGYQGGRWNDVEDYLMVSQSDAHAWVEAWLPTGGWRLIDPTAAVAPERIEQGINDALSEEEQNYVQGSWSGSNLWLRLQIHLDAASYAWQRWVLSYDEDAQEGLLTRWFGGNEPWRITLWLIGLGLTGAGIFAWVMVRQRQPKHIREETRLALKLQRKLAARGIDRRPGETLRQYLTRAAQTDAANAELLNLIGHLYDAIAYGGRTEQIPQLRQAIKRV